MSDELVIKTLNDELSRLRKELADTAAEAKKRRIDGRGVKSELEKLKAERDALIADRDGWKAKAEAAPSDVAKENERLKGEIKVRDLKAKFNGVSEQLGEGVTIEHLWKFNDFDPAAADVESLDVDGLVKGWRDAVPGLFKSADVKSAAPPGGAQKPGLRINLPAGRGAPDDASSRFTVRRTSDLGNPIWMQKNQARIAEAAAEGTLTYVDG